MKNLLVFDETLNWIELYGINSGWSFEVDQRKRVQLHFKELSESE